jgi:hypothetical protein
MKDKYILEIYYPGSSGNVWVYFQSETPFLSISKGDIINPGMFPDADADTMLRVTSVEHIVWSAGTHESKHKICVYTENIEDNYDARFGFAFSTSRNAPHPKAR